MSKTTRKTKSLRLTPEDIAILDVLRRYHGVASENEAIRMALRSALRELPPEAQAALKGLSIPPVA